MTDDDAKKIEADEADEAGVWVVGEISKERVITVPNVAAVEAEIERLRALVTSTRAEADAATQRAAEGELAARTVEARLTAALDQAESSLSDTIAEAERGTTYRIELQRTIDRLTARLQTAERVAHEWRERAGRVAESSWDKAHVEAAFKAFWVDGAREHTNSAGAWADLRARIEAEEAGA